MIAQDTVKEISTLNLTQSVKPKPIFTYENETNTSNTSEMKPNQSKREREATMLLSPMTIY